MVIQGPCRATGPRHSVTPDPLSPGLVKPQLLLHSLLAGTVNEQVHLRVLLRGTKLLKK